MSDDSGFNHDRSVALWTLEKAEARLRLERTNLMAKKPTAARERARALAQECVLFGGLKGHQWDGLTELLMVFAEREAADAITELDTLRETCENLKRDLVDAVAELDRLRGEATDSTR